ncbi:MAG: type IV pilus modification PilV family protein [Actinomycetota bacterium]
MSRGAHERARRFFTLARDEGGFTLIELAVAVGLFAIVLTSISLLFERALTTTGRSRFDQLGKTLAQEKLEEIRSLPYYVAKRTDARDVDILDRYFPAITDRVSPPGTYDSATDVWAYSNPETVTPTGSLQFTRTVAVQFVRVETNGSVSPVEPIDGYNSDDLDRDRPASDSLKVTVTVAWTSQAQARSVALDTVISSTRQEEPKVEATGSVLGLQVTGLTFVDGDANGVAADILAELAKGELTFREVAQLTSQASADALEIVERNPGTNVPLQDPLPSGGESASTAPNSGTGTSQSGADSLAAGSMFSINEPFATIASWGSSESAATSAARVSPQHTINPEGSATINLGGVVLNARNEGEQDPLQMLRTTSLVAEILQRSTPQQTTVEGSVDLGGVQIWASRDFLADPNYAGTVLIDAVHVDVESSAGEGPIVTTVNWAVEGLRIWDPQAGAYTDSWTFGFSSLCGGWVGQSPETGGECGATFENPNPIVIPAAYAGEGGTTSLVITTGATVRDSTSDAGIGASGAQAAQKNVITITTRDDVLGAAALEPMFVGLGDANSNVSYVEHEH